MLEFVKIFYDWIKFFLTSYFGNIIEASVIILIGFVIGKVLERFSFKSLKSFELNKLTRQAGIKQNSELFLSKTAAVIVYFVAIIMSLQRLGLTLAILQIIVIVVLIIILVVLILALKDFVPNALAGFLITHKKMFAEGDKVNIDNIEGIVKSITLLKTQLEKNDGEIIHLSNINVINKKIKIIKIKEF